MGFALLGIIIMVAGFIQYSSKWDDENCCQDSPPASCASTNCGGVLPVATMCAIPGNEDASFFIDDGCCYGVDSSGPNGLLFPVMRTRAFSLMTGAAMELTHQVQT